MTAADDRAEIPVQPTVARKGGVPLHPLFFAAFPILSLYSANLAIVPLSDLWRPLFIAVAVAAGVSLILWPICRSLERAAAAASILVLTTILYSTITAKFDFLSNLFVWGAVVFILCGLAAWKAQSPKFLNILSICLVVVASVNIVYGQARIKVDQMYVKLAAQGPGQTVKIQRPDIFYFILDGYGRSDALKRVMNFDNSSFISDLTKRGFYIAKRSHSNYVQTEISLSSSLNLRFIPDLVPNVSRDNPDRTPFDALISNNGLSRFLRDQGYRTIDITSGFPPIRFPNADLWLQNGSNVTLFETTLLQMTPLVPGNGGMTSMFVWRYHTLYQAFQNVRDLATPTPRPRFVFIHILAPHPPFVLAADGSFVRPNGPFGYWDGSDYIGRCGTREDYMNGYMGQATAIDREVLKTVDTLMAGSPVKPIIILQGDHGSKSRLDQSDINRTDVTECFENLEAFYVPDIVRNKLYPTITPVNEFRLILSQLFQADLPLLPDRSWYSPFGRPFDFTDVTDEVMKTQSKSSWIPRAPAPRSAKDSVWPSPMAE